ncbi:hypothetical protein [Gaoshiqia sp. Z1-71]|uniref:hypothetical protein n=1 Tax=Gaoshiqia hydrogeniformans TaxID=3290090 RepID=UPI003BF88F96
MFQFKRPIQIFILSALILSSNAGRAIGVNRGGITHPDQFTGIPKHKKLTEREASYHLVTTVNAAVVEPVAETGGTSVITGTTGTYREAGAGIRNRFALDFEVDRIDVPHLAVITYPDDKPRTMEIMLQHFTKHLDFQSHTGVMTGEEYPLSDGMKEFRIVFWPKARRQAFIFMTAEDNYPAAVSEIKIFEIREFGIPSDRNYFSGSVPARSAGLFYEDPVLFHSFGTGRDKKGFTEATDRMITYLRSLGQTTFDYPLVWYAGPLYGSNVEPYDPVAEDALGGKRPHPEDYPRYLLKRLAEQDMKFTAGLHIHTLPSLNKNPLADTARINSGEETIININKEGELWFGHWHGADPNFNAADPRVMSAVNALVTEICDKYAEEPAFDGISLVISRPKLFSFGSLASGYNDINLQRFQKESGIEIPGYTPGKPDRFKKSYDWLMSSPETKKAWIDWRCQVLYKHYSQMALTIASHRPDLKLNLNIFVHLTQNDRLADYLNESPVEAMREMGFDPELYRDEPNIVVTPTLVPADLRWARSHYTPVATNANRTVFTAPEVVSSMNDLPRVGVTIHDRYFEDAIGREEPLEGLKNLGVDEMVWRASTLNPAGFHSLEPYVFALNYLDAASIIKGGYVIGSFGMDDELTAFSQAFQSLPAVKFDDVPNMSDPVRVRQKVVDGKMYFYVLNCLPKPVTFNIKLNNASDVTDLVENKKLSKIRSLSLQLAPYDLRVFESPSTGLSFTGSDFKPDEDWLKQLRRQLDSLEKLAGLKSTETEKYKPYLDQARACWNKKHYARLYFLLQDGWTKELKTLISD